MAVTAARRIEVSIDELVLHGFDPSSRDEIASSVRAELAAALVGWMPRQRADVGRVDGGSFDVPTAAGPTVVGRGAARAIGKALIAGAASPEHRGQTR
jgi:hypothetical protein